MNPEPEVQEDSSPTLPVVVRVGSTIEPPESRVFSDYFGVKARHVATFKRAGRPSDVDQSVTLNLKRLAAVRSRFQTVRIYYSMTVLPLCRHV
jgi:hypothetical protein